MNDIQLKKLQKSLTRSAKKAQKYWVRGLIGFQESDQGFFPVVSVPIQNTIKNKETTLAEFIEDVGNLYAEFKELTDRVIAHEQEFENYKSMQEELQYQKNQEMEALAERVSVLEAFKID